MAYTPYEWTVNSYLNPTRMNAIEQGIAEASQAAESASGEFRTIEELIGTQSIAGIGDGTLTGATWKINNDLTELSATVTTLNSNLSNLFSKQNQTEVKVNVANASEYKHTITIPRGYFAYVGIVADYAKNNNGSRHLGINNKWYASQGAINNEAVRMFASDFIDATSENKSVLVNLYQTSGATLEVNIRPTVVLFKVY